LIRDLAPGTVVGSWRIVRKLGQGGMGAVYEALDPSRGPIALKFLLADEKELVARFEREARAATAVQHPHVVGLLAVAREQGRLVLALELLPGGTLAALVKREGPLPWRRAALLGAKVAHGLAAIHAAGFIHRDLKPENVLLDAQGTPKIADFGLVRRVSGQTVSEGLTRAGDVLGTYAYMSPEQAEGAPVDQRSDLYGLGATLYCLLAGVPPHEGSSMDLVKKLLLEQPSSFRERGVDVPPELERLVRRLLEKAPAARPASAASVALELEEIAAGSARARRSLLPWLGLTLAAATGGVLAVAIKGSAPSPVVPPPVGPPPAPAPVAPPTPTVSRAEELFQKRYEEVSRASSVLVVGLEEPRHPASVRAVGIARRGGSLVAVSGGDEGTVRFWDPKSGDEVASFDAKAAVRSLAVSADGRLVAYGTRGDRAGVYDLDEGRLVWSRSDLKGEVVVDIAGDEIALADATGHVVRIGARDGKPLGAPFGIGKLIWFVRYAPGGLRIAVGCRNDGVAVCDVGTGGVTFSSVGGLDAAEGVYLEGGGLLATTGGSRFALEDAALAIAVEGSDPDDSPGDSLGLAALPGERFATAGACGNVHVWGARGEHVFKFRAGASDAVAVAAAPDGERILVVTGGADGTVRFFDLDGDKAIERRFGGSRTHRGIVNSVRVSSDGKEVLTANEDGSVKLWDVEKASLLTSLEGLDQGAVRGAAFLPGSQRRVLSVGRYGGLKATALDAALRASTVYEDRVVGVSGDGTTGLALSEDGKRALVPCTYHRRTLLLDEREGAWGARELTSVPQGSTSAAFSPDGARVVFSNLDPRSFGFNGLGVVDLTSGKVSPVRDETWNDQVVFAGSEPAWINNGGTVRCRGWSYPGKTRPTGIAATDVRVAALFGDGRIVLLDAFDGREVAAIDLGPAQDIPRCAAFDRSGSRLWVGTGRGGLLRLDLAR
jgi:serine/threonine-protein kinase